MKTLKGDRIPSAELSDKIRRGWGEDKAETLEDLLALAPARLRRIFADRDLFCHLLRMAPQHRVARKLGCQDKTISIARSYYGIPDRPIEMPCPQFEGWSKARVRTIVWQIMLGMGYCPRDCPVAFCESDGALITPDCPIVFFYPPKEVHNGSE